MTDSALFIVNTDEPRWSNGSAIGDGVLRNDGSVLLRMGDIVRADLPADEEGDVVAYGPDRDGVQNDGRYFRFADLDPYFGPLNEPTRVEDVTLEPEVPIRPTVDFSGDSRETAREYARSLKHRHNLPATNHVLTLVVEGDQVDAYELNSILPDALSSATRRGKTAVDRREVAKKARYLAHIVQGVLENHADNLPAYAEGDRSRAVIAEKARADEGWATAVKEQQRADDAEALLVEVQPALVSANEEVERATERLDEAAKYREAADAEVTRLHTQIKEIDDRLQEVVAERDAAAQVITYVVGLLDTAAEKERVLGYWDGALDSRS